jgi:1-acyl-sn-glycerol-3-phosphate acyltransferase
MGGSRRFVFFCLFVSQPPFPPSSGRHHLPPTPYTIIFNHVSYLDGLLLAELAAPAALAKASVARAPCVGPWTRALQCAFVDRAAAAGGGTVAARAARLADPRWPPLAVAPEGTTKPARCLLRFRTGAFAAAVATATPVVPVLLDYAPRAARGRGGRGGVNPGWGVMQSTLVHLLRVHAQLDTAVTVTVLPPMAPAPGEAAAAFGERVRRAMGAAGGLPLVDAGLEEWAALKAARACVDWTGGRLLVGGRAVGEKEA